MLSHVTPAQLTSLLVRRDPRQLPALVAIMLFFHRLIGLVTTNVLLERTYRERAKVGMVVMMMMMMMLMMMKMDDADDDDVDDDPPMYCWRGPTGSAPR